MKWQKAPEELKALIERVVAGIDCVKRPMFGYPAFFINGNMFAGLFQSYLFLRLSPAQVTDLTQRHLATYPLEPMPRRPMKDYFVIPEILHHQEKVIQAIAAQAATYVRALPPKGPRPKKLKAAKTTSPIEATKRRTSIHKASVKRRPR